MAEHKMFESLLRSAGDLAGVFEYDGDAGYFYLYKTKNENNRKIISAIHILSGVPDFDEGNVTIRWDSVESKVGLFIRGQLWAVFDSETDAKYGGNYHISNQPQIPADVTNSFEK